MQAFNLVAHHAAFLALALLAGAVAALNLAGRAAAPVLSPGAAVFLGQFAGFVAVAGLGLPSGLAQGVAPALGTAAAWTGPR